jgi:Xaa-Pro aminopeptidase
MGRTLQPAHLAGRKPVTPALDRRTRVEEIADALAEASIEGWLFYDFRRSDPLAYRILGLDEDGITTRRWFYYIPAAGAPQTLVSAVEVHRLDELPAGARVVYSSEKQMVAGLGSILTGAGRVAMNYSPNCAIPYVSRVDAGTVELVRSLGVEVVSAADLIQRFEAMHTAAELESHRRAAAALGQIVDETFAEIAHRTRAGRQCSELSIRQFVLKRISAHGLISEEPPIVAANAHSADPHFSPAPANERPIGRGDFVLLDLWAKERSHGAIYGDLTWTGFVDETVPDEHARIFEIVARARDAAVDLVQRRVAAKEPVSGEEADRAAREVIEAAGFGEAFVHRTGHSIGREVHGNGANLDSMETRDHRLLLDHTCFSIEPGIYLTGRFGIRSELDMTIEDGHAQISGPSVQREIVPILARFPAAPPAR